MCLDSTVLDGVKCSILDKRIYRDGEARARGLLKTGNGNHGFFTEGSMNLALMYRQRNVDDLETALSYLKRGERKCKKMGDYY